MKKPIKDTPLVTKEKKKQTETSTTKHKGNYYTFREQTPSVKALLLGEYYHLHSGQIHPVTQRFIDRVSTALMEWASKPDSLRITDFSDSEQISMDPYSYYLFVNKFAQLKLAHDYAMRRIASRRELGGLNNKYNASVLMRAQSHYDTTWQAQEIKIAEQMRNMNGQGTTPMKVVMQEFEKLEGEQAPSYVQVQADEYHAKRSEFAEQEQALLEEKVLTMATPEQVASGITKQSLDSRWTGSGQYVAKSKVERTIKENRAKIYE
jgi:hypothetical protein